MTYRLAGFNSSLVGHEKGKKEKKKKEERKKKKKGEKWIKKKKKKKKASLQGEYFVGYASHAFLTNCLKILSIHVKIIDR